MTLQFHSLNSKISLKGGGVRRQRSAKPGKGLGVVGVSSDVRQAPRNLTNDMPPPFHFIERAHYNEIYAAPSKKINPQY